MNLRSKSIDYYLGNFDECFCGYSNNESIRKNAASGGMVTQLLIYMLDNDYIDGVFLSRLNIKNGKLIPVSFIATTTEEILSCQSSIYIDFDLSKSLKEVESFKGRLAAVALPCQLKMLDKLTNKIIKIGLFCGHTSERELIENVLRQKINLCDIKEFCFRRGRWRGNSQIRLASGETINFPYFDFGMFQNIFFHMPKKCLYCRDHTAEGADISFGDLWLKEFKKKRNKYSCVLSRQEKMTKILLEMSDRHFVSIEKLDPKKVIKSQKRSLIYHKFTTNALKKIKLSHQKHNCRWNDYIAAFLILFNMNISNKKVSGFIYKLPKELVFSYMVLVRVFLSF